MANPRIKVLEQSKTGLNTKLLIDGSVYTNNQAYNAAKAGKFDILCAVKNNKGTKFVKTKPDKSVRNNIGK